MDNIPAWLLRIGAPFFSAPICDMMNLSLSSSTVPKQWKADSILPIPKIPSPLASSNYRPISITQVLSRLLERIVVTDYIYPSFQSPLPNLSFLDQFAFQPTASSTVALIHLLHTITTLLQTNQSTMLSCTHWIFQRPSTVSNTVLCSTNICSWKCQTTSIIGLNRFSMTTHTRFRNKCSEFQKIMASIIQGSGISPASHFVTASDLHSV